MVRYEDINKAIITKIKTITSVAVLSTDETEDIIRPSFQVSLGTIKATDFVSECVDRGFTVRIYYFPTDRDKNKIELLDMQNNLEEMFLQDNMISITPEFEIEVKELDFEIIDKVLHCSFDLFMSEEYVRVDDKPKMEELDYK